MNNRIITSFLLLILAPVVLFAQKVELTGRVVDTHGEPVIAAGVLIQGTSQGVVTDFEGNFSISVEKGQTIEFSSVGFKTLTILFNGQSRLNITLEDETTILDEVVVIGYGTMKKREMTSAISHVASKDLNHVTSLDAKMLLQGKVSGVTVSNTALADPNQQGSIQIRGLSSRSAGTGPLYVVDGIPGADMTNINPADIASIDVLKDGAASAIYGTRGGNGVIIVNLKKGSKDGNVHTNYSSSFTLNVPKQELEMLTAEQFRLYRAYNNPSLDLGANTDWLKASMRTGYQHMHTLSFSGGNVKTNYRATVDFRDARGVDLRSTRREYGSRVTINHTTASGLFTFTVNATPRMIKRDVAIGFGAMKNNPTAPIYDNTTANGFYHFPAGGSGTNNVEQAAETIGETEIFLMETSASAQLNLLPLLAPKKKDMSLTSQLIYSDHPVNKFGGSYSKSTYSGNLNSGITGSGSRDYNLRINRNLEWVNNFSTHFGKHNLRLMAGYSYSYGVGSGLSASNARFDSDLITYNDLGSGLEMAKSGEVGFDTSKSDHKLIAFFARVNYDWKERYLMSMSLRHEGSSRFGANHKWGNFPAVSVGWRISDESFMSEMSFIDDLKLRYDFGVTGNQDFGSYLSLSKFRAYGWYEYEGQKFKVWGPSSNVNSELRWEKGYNQNVGLDFSLFQYRLSGSLNYFNRKQVDLLGTYSVPVPPNLTTSIFANVGTMRNRGFEFDIKYIPIRRDGLNWSIVVLGATNDNIFESFSNDVYRGKSYYSTCEMSNPNNPGYLQRIEEGQRVGNYFTYRYAGVDKSGNWLIFDVNDNIIPISEGSEEDKTITGNGLPWFTGSISTSLVIKNWDFSMSMRCALGFEIFNVHDFYYGLQAMTTNLLTSAYARNAHITSGQNAITDYFLEPGDYLKLDNISVGYSKQIGNRFLQNIRLFVTANNLYTLTRFTGIDPSVYEVNGLTPGTFGGGAHYYPSVFQFVFGIQLAF
jgi:TonB-linked SusC/RagA family outer membrane protein